MSFKRIARRSALACMLVALTLPAATNRAIASVPIPTAPTNVVATAGNGTATVTWSMPMLAAMYTVAGYQVNVYEMGTKGPEYQWGITRIRLNAARYTVTGLTNGHNYAFTVQFKISTLNSNTVEQSDWSIESLLSNYVVPTAPPAQPVLPAAPTNVTAIAGNGQATVYWTPGAQGSSPITRYIISAYSGTSSLLLGEIQVGVVSSATFPGLSNAQSYSFAVRAISAVGTGPQSARSAAVVLATVPSSPLNVVVTRGIGQATVSWSAPTYNGGSTILGYIVSAVTPTGVRQTAPVDAGTTSVLITGLAAGQTYSFFVTAVNAIGQSTAATTSAVTLARVPSAPASVTATPGDGSISAQWYAPSYDGGSPILGYQVTVWDGTHPAVSLWTTATTLSIPGLANNTNYTVSVVAVNAVGLGAPFSATALPRNLAPTISVPAAQTVHHGDAIAVAVNATNLEAADHLILSASGVPTGATFTDHGNGTGTLAGQAEVPAGTYSVTFSVNDGHNASVSAATTLNVTREQALVQPYPSAPSVIALTNPKKNSVGSVTIRAAIREVTDPEGYADIHEATPVTYTLKPLSGASTLTGNASTTGEGKGSVLTSVYSFRDVIPGVYILSIDVGGTNYQGSAKSLLTVYRPTATGLVKGDGSLQVNSIPTTVKFNVKYNKNGKVSGSLTYTENRATGQVTLHSTKIDGLTISGHRAYFTGTGTLQGQPGYRFAVSVKDAQVAGMPTLGLSVIDPSFSEVAPTTSAPIILPSGAISIHA